MEHQPPYRAELEKIRKAKDMLGRHIHVSIGILAIMAVGINMKWEKRGDPIPEGVKPGWEDAREKEFEALRARDALQPENFADRAAYNRAWSRADAEAQAAWRERLAQEE